jgi:U2 small nuclear ribonucleoprotein B''
VYVHNLNEKVRKEELKKSLYHVFSPHGKIMEIHAQKLYKLRGQAWIIYENEQSAIKAVQSMANYSFYGKPMRVNFARVKSDIISKKDGTFVPRPKRKTKSERKRTKRKKVEAEVKATAPVAAAPVSLEVPPNNILFIEELPSQCNAMMLEMLFRQYEGYSEVRLVDGKPGIAFVEFTGVAEAARAKDTLQGFSITPTNQMRITFAKK